MAFAQAENFNFTRGDTETLNVVVKDSEGNIIDISDWVFTLTIETVRGELNQIVNGVIVDNEVSFDIDTENMLGRFNYDMQYKDSDNKIETFLKGVMIFEEDYSE